MSPDPRFTVDKFDFESEGEPSKAPRKDDSNDEAEDDHDEYESDIGEGMDPEGFAGPNDEHKTVKPLSHEALAAFNIAQARTGVIYISRIPPGMQPTKVRHIMSQYGEIGRVYLQQEDPKRAYLRRKYTTTKKAHFTEGWVEFKDKKVARRVAELLNASPIGGKKGTRWRDDIWTLKYLPKFKWNMLTEQVAHEAAVHAGQLRVELAQSKLEQRDYLKNVELARVLQKRAKKKREQGKELVFKPREHKKRPASDEPSSSNPPRAKKLRQDNTEPTTRSAEFSKVLGSVF